MEILDGAEPCFVVSDDLLDFTLGAETEEQVYDLKTSRSSSSSLTTAFGDDSLLSGSFPVSFIHFYFLWVDSAELSRSTLF